MAGIDFLKSFYTRYPEATIVILEHLIEYIEERNRGDK